MTYDEVVKVWAGETLSVDPASITSVQFDMTEGYACCGGRDPDCYCSYAESPRLEANVFFAGKKRPQTIDYIDFTSTLTAVLAIAARGD